jgi:predicted amidohydrolase
MENLSITSIQTPLVWQDIDKNLEIFGKKIENIREHTDIIVLPEMFTTGFIMEASKFAEKMDGQSVEWMKRMASIKNAMIIGSLVIEESGKYLNRLLAVHPNGEINFYDKRHLFAMAGENKNYTKGEKNIIISYKNWRIKALICYDLRFPVWSRNTDDYDILIYVANWPATRSFHWKILLQARAIENQAYVVGVNRIGEDGSGLHYSGDSCVFDPLGHKLSTIDPDQEMVETIAFDKATLEKIRLSLPFNADSDCFTIC